MNSKTFSFDSKFGKVEKFNSQFHSVKIYIAYAGKNRNGTYISKETFEKMIPSLYGIPIVGEWKDEDFHTHGGKIEITDDGVEYIDTTMPYGYVDSSASVNWEMVLDEDGVEREYLTTNAFLWTSRYKNALRVLDNENNQSMEIIVNDGGDLEEDNSYFEILDAEFSALCILGSEIEGCFEGAKISQFNLDKDKFKAEFNLMVKELKESIKGGEKVDNEKNIDVEVEDEEIIETEDQALPIGEEEISTEISLPEEEKEEVIEGEVEEEPVLEVESEVEEPIELEEEVEETEEVEVEETEVVDSVEISEDFSKLENEYKALEEKFELLDKENAELREFKSIALAKQKAEEVNEIFAKYATMLDNSDMEDLFEPALEMEIDALEKELSFRLVQKKFDFSKIVKKDSTKLSIVKNTEDKENVYGSASVYFNK